MLKNIKDISDLRQVLLSLLSTSGTLAGISIALVSIVNLKLTDTTVESLADDLFLFSSLGFVTVCYLIFFALRHHHSSRVRHWNIAIDLIFLASLTLLVFAGFVTVYAIL